MDDNNDENEQNPNEGEEEYDPNDMQNMGEKVPTRFNANNPMNNQKQRQIPWFC